MNTYIAGNVIEAFATFVADNGSDENPTNVFFKYAITENNVTSPTTTLVYSGASVPAVGVVANIGTGQFEAQVDTTNLPGYWLYEWQSVGTGQAVATGSFLVTPLPL